MWRTPCLRSLESLTARRVPICLLLLCTHDYRLSVIRLSFIDCKCMMKVSPTKRRYPCVAKNFRSAVPFPRLATPRSFTNLLSFHFKLDKLDRRRCMPPAIPPSDPSKHYKPASFSAHSVHPQAQTTRSSQSNNTIFPSLGIFLPHQNIATRRRRSVRSRGAYQQVAFQGTTKWSRNAERPKRERDAPPTDAPLLHGGDD
jgi:hypothetical protein